MSWKCRASLSLLYHTTNKNNASENSYHPRIWKQKNPTSDLQNFAIFVWNKKNLATFFWNKFWKMRLHWRIWSKDNLAWDKIKDCKKYTTRNLARTIHMDLHHFYVTVDDSHLEELEGFIKKGWSGTASKIHRNATEEIDKMHKRRWKAGQKSLPRLNSKRCSHAKGKYEQKKMVLCPPAPLCETEVVSFFVTGPSFCLEFIAFFTRAWPHYLFFYGLYCFKFFLFLTY